MKKLRLMTAFAVLLLLAACSRQQEAESLVKRFMKENLVDNRMAEVRYSHVDSTFYVTDSVVKALRAGAGSIAAYKSPVNYAEGATTPKMMFMNVRYKDARGNDHRQTFYLDSELTRVICFKGN